VRALILAPFADDALARLRRRVDVVYESWLDSGRLWDPAELGARAATEGISILVVEADFVFAEVFEAAPGLRLVGVCRNALNQVDMEAASAHEVRVVHAPGRNTNAVAEMTVGLLLALARRIVDAHALVSEGGWSDPAQTYRDLRGREIAGATAGVIGFGQIGREVTRKLLAMGARVLAYDPIVPSRDMAALGAEAASLDELGSESDFVTLHVPDAPDTYRMIDEAFLARMKHGAYLVNTGSGPAVDAAALASALREGRIAGAAVDVFDGHPLPRSHPLLEAPNVILTPHIGGATAETIARHSRIMADEIERLLDGRPLQHVVNAEYSRQSRG
jgi:phosphoglycerate dehydrogenase-like enzyme